MTPKPETPESTNKNPYLKFSPEQIRLELKWIEFRWHQLEQQDGQPENYERLTQTLRDREKLLVEARQTLAEAAEAEKAEIAKTIPYMGLSLIEIEKELIRLDTRLDKIVDSPNRLSYAQEEAKINATVLQLEKARDIKNGKISLDDVVSEILDAQKEANRSYRPKHVEELTIAELQEVIDIKQEELSKKLRATTLSGRDGAGKLGKELMQLRELLEHRTEDPDYPANLGKKEAKSHADKIQEKRKHTKPGSQQFLF